jgi:FdhD protein
LSLFIQSHGTKTFFKKDIPPLEKVDHLAIERPLEIALRVKNEETPVSLTMRTPGDDKCLALGYLLAEGIVKSKLDIDWENFREGQMEDKVYIPLIKTPKNLKGLERGTVMNSSCGVCGKTSLEGLDSLEVKEKNFKNFFFSHHFLYGLPEKLKERQSVFKKTGGLHGAALVDENGQLLAIKEDVGRHNAVDKLFGLCFLNNIETEGRILLLSGRASYELLQKAARAKISLVAAIGPPSSMAVSLAKKYSMTLVGFLKDNSFNCYEGEKRISYE